MMMVGNGCTGAAKQAPALGQYCTVPYGQNAKGLCANHKNPSKHSNNSTSETAHVPIQIGLFSLHTSNNPTPSSSLGTGGMGVDCHESQDNG